MGIGRGAAHPSAARGSPIGLRRQRPGRGLTQIRELPVTPGEDVDPNTEIAVHSPEQKETGRIALFVALDRWRDQIDEDQIDTSSLDDLGDVTFTGLLADDVLQYDGDNWINVTLANLGIDHTTDITGLEGDRHPDMTPIAGRSGGITQFGSPDTLESYTIRANPFGNGRVNFGSSGDTFYRELDDTFIFNRTNQFLFFDSHPTALSDGGMLNIVAAGLNIEVEAGEGIIVDAYTVPSDQPIVKPISWLTQDEAISLPETAGLVIFLSMANGGGSGPIPGTELGVLVQRAVRPTPPQVRDEIFLGAAIHNGDDWQELSSPVVINNAAHTLEEFLNGVVGPTFIFSGLKVTEDLSFGLDRAAGIVWEQGRNWHVNQKDPNREAFTADPSFSFKYVDSQFTNVSAFTSTIDPTQFESSPGVVSAVGGGAKQTTIQRVFIDPADNFWILYGQNTYSTYEEAVQQLGVDNANTVIPPLLLTGSIFLGFITSERAQTSWTDDASTFSEAAQGSGGSGGGGGGAVLFDELTDTPSSKAGAALELLRVNAGATAIEYFSDAIYLLSDGTRELTANWDAGPFRITAETLESDVVTGTPPLVVASTTVVPNLNADLLDGLEASAFLQSLPAHASDHDLGGSDVITGLGPVVFSGDIGFSSASAFDVGSFANPASQIIGDTVMVKDILDMLLGSVTGNLDPTTDDSQDLGRAAKKWRFLTVNTVLADSAIFSDSLDLDGSFRVGDSDGSHHYVFAASNLSADRTITFPLLIADDTSVYEDHIQTLINKTMGATTFTGDATMGANDVLIDQIGSIVFDADLGTPVVKITANGGTSNFDLDFQHLVTNKKGFIGLSIQSHKLFASTANDVWRVLDSGNNIILAMYGSRAATIGNAARPTTVPSEGMLLFKESTGDPSGMGALSAGIFAKASGGFTTMHKINENDVVSTM